MDEYAKFNLSFWGLSSQNEPTDGDVPNFSFNCLGFNAETLRIFISENLGPALKANGYDDLKLMTCNDQRDVLPAWPLEILGNDSDAFSYVDGIAVHWYMDMIFGPRGLQETHNFFPDKFILYTEACAGSVPGQRPVLLGSWERADTYAHDIIEVGDYTIFARNPFTIWLSWPYYLGRRLQWD